jgi:hypothetical protein
MGSGQRPLAVMTIWQREPIFGPRWLRHYLTQVPAEDVYILHHPLESAIGTPGEWAPVDAMRSANEQDPTLHTFYANVIPVHNTESFSHDWLRETVARFQHFLLKSYRWVLFVEADELVLCPPVSGSPPPTLVEFLARETSDDAAGGPQVFRTTGYEVIHRREAEPPLDPHAACWLEHRSSWYRSALYSKPTLARRPLQWVRGFHTIDWPATPGIPLIANHGAGHPGLLLVHLHKVDFDIALARSRENATRHWSAADVAIGAGVQNRITTEAEMAAFFDRNIDDGRPVANSLEAIPDAIRALI